MRDVFVIMMIFGLLPVVFFRPFAGIILWYWIAFMNPHRLTWGIAYDLPIAMVVGTATIVAWMLSDEPKKLKLDSISILILCLSIWVSVTTLFAIQQEAAILKWDRTVKILFTTVMTMAIVNSRERIQALIWIVIISVGFYAAEGGIFTLLGQAKFRVWGPSASSLGSNNYLGFVFALSIPLIRYLQLNTNNLYLRLGLWLLLVCTLLAIIGTQSRGAFVTACTVLALLTLRSRRRVVILAITGIALAFVVVVHPEGWIERMQSILEYQEDPSMIGRFKMWDFAYQIALRYPIFGGGFHANLDLNLFKDLTDYGEVPKAIHSIYFEVLAEHGFPGLTIFLLLGLAALRSCQRTRKAARALLRHRWSYDLASMVQISIIGYFVGGVVSNLAFFDFYYMLVALIYLNERILKQEIIDRDAESDTALTPVAGSVFR